jgi:APA family basic amino acid/polyamine antiporter
VTTATALVVSSMIGVGIFGTTGFLAGDLGSPSLVLWIWLAGAACAFLGAMCYSELGINLPSSGGEYVYLTRAYGPTWGFMTGWVSFFAGFSAPIAGAALAFSHYLGHVCSACSDDKPRVLFGSGDYSVLFGKEQLIACALVVLFTILNLVGVQRISRIQNVLTAAKIVILLSFIALAFTAGNGNWQNFSMTTARTSTAPLAQQFGISLFFIYLSYSGWNAATYVAEELKHPAKTLPIALAFGTALVAALYIVLNVVFIYAMPLGTMKGEVAVGALAASKLFGPEVATAFAALMALSLMSSVNAQILTGPRVYYAMAKNGAFLGAAAKVHPQWHTPYVAIIAQGICTMVMTLTPFRDLVSYIGFTLGIFTAMGVASLFYFRKQPGWQKLPVVSFMFPLVPILFLIPEVWIVIVGVWLRPYVSLAAVVTMVTGALVYHFRTRARAPQPAVETY